MPTSVLSRRRVLVAGAVLLLALGTGAYLLWLRPRLPQPGSPVYEAYVEAFEVGVAALDAAEPKNADKGLSRAIELVPQEPAFPSYGK